MVWYCQLAQENVMYQVSEATATKIQQTSFVHFHFHLYSLYINFPIYKN